MSCGILCNDVHSRLNPVRVARIARPQSTAEASLLVQEAATAGMPVSICGARHAMGGQQFGEDTLLLDCRSLTAVGEIDRDRGLVEAGAGIIWPDLIAALHAVQQGLDPLWTIRQKQTGADDLTLGGALAANIHGRGLRMAPIISDVEAFTLVDTSGQILRCSRVENAELFRHAIGGYGCFGIITSVQLRLTPRCTVERCVEITTIDLLIPALEERIADAALYGDFQFSIDECSPDFLRRGVLATYHPVANEDHPPARELSAADWEELIHLAHTDRAKVFEVYSGHYLASHGSRYGSDTHQLGVYLEDYHCGLDAKLDSPPATEMISELYVPREYLVTFMARAADLLRPSGIPVIYGTVRLIERDTESALPWARQDFACVIFNLHTEHHEQGIARSAAAFQSLIDLALSLGGSYFLTYHRWATRGQLLQAYPGFPDFLRAKDRYDPESRFQSQWWRHHRDLFSAP
ncbi:FAD-binding oxidoreductase [Luteolibacter sp. GHJ8]|uniref:FAD-binding oxidoreductase n=1 Tax=Luteolibacter rhizosphaerae TaxID=2989719 RepID=A0ABT3G3Q9_9BACT|nr:FAD-binding oxidoreductase [Luteolibacter rhizosphaerae]MCW1914481.1 FAD-binding oxidoreductase [Luteolibacter rhizosphaerae]